MIKRRLSQRLVSPRRFERAAATQLLGFWRMRGADPSIVRPVVVANGVPKAGTHLLEAALRPLAMDLGRFVSDYGSSRRVERQSDEVLLRSLRSARGGELVRAHLGWSDSLADWIRAGSGVTRHVLIIRDPRAIAVSECHYVRELNTHHRAHKSLAARSPADALLATIQGFSDQGFEQAPLVDRLQRFSEWLNCDGEVVQVVRFEDLIGMSVGERSNVLAELLGLKLSDSGEVAPLVAHTFRRGSPDAWREEWTDVVDSSFSRSGGPELLTRWGYAE